MQRNEIVSRHHASQLLIARNTVAELHPLWNILDFYDLKGTSPSWLKAARPVIERGYLTSQYVAAEFVRNYRAAVLPAAPPLPLSVPNPFGAFGIHNPPPRDIQIRIMVSMQVTGPNWLAENTPPGVDPSLRQDLMTRGFSKSSGSATRLVLNGGRGMIVLAAAGDPAARGVVSVPSELSDCKSCLALASRPIMKTEGERKMRAVAVGHDFCQCSAAPIF